MASADTLVGMNVWLSVISAVAALAGAWGGQWISARRDDRRWEREQRREDLRWERDVRRDRRDRTLRAYTEFLTKLRQYLSAATKMQTAVVNRSAGAGNEHDAVASEHEAELLYQELAEKAAAVEVFAPLEIYARAEAATSFARDLWEVVWDSWAAVNGAEPGNADEAVEAIKAAKRKAWEARTVFVEQIREFLDE